MMAMSNYVGYSAMVGMQMARPMSMDVVDCADVADCDDDMLDCCDEEDSDDMDGSWCMTCFSAHLAGP